jgi:hypothetical protein
MEKLFNDIKNQLLQNTIDIEYIFKDLTAIIQNDEIIKNLTKEEIENWLIELCDNLSKIDMVKMNYIKYSTKIYDHICKIHNITKK